MGLGLVRLLLAADDMWHGTGIRSTECPLVWTDTTSEVVDLGPDLQKNLTKNLA